MAYPGVLSGCASKNIQVVGKVGGRKQYKRRKVEEVGGNKKMGNFRLNKSHMEPDLLLHFGPTQNAGLDSGREEEGVSVKSG